MLSEEGTFIQPSAMQAANFPGQLLCLVWAKMFKTQCLSLVWLSNPSGKEAHDEPWGRLDPGLPRVPRRVRAPRGGGRGGGAAGLWKGLAGVGRRQMGEDGMGWGHTAAHVVDCGKPGGGHSTELPR